MNWTGGKLQRQVKVAKSLQDKQKQHFANVRTNMQNGSDHHESFVPSFMQEPRAHTSLGSKRHSSSRTHQSRLEDYSQVAPVARRLQSLTPRVKPRSSREYDDLSTGNVQNSHRSKQGESDHQHRRPKMDIRRAVQQAISISSQMASHDTPFANSETKQRLKRARSGSSPPPMSKADTQGMLDSKLDDQRRRLLAQSDWLGLDRSRPLQIGFASDRGKEKVAKRRKLNDHDRVRQYEAQQERPRVPSIRNQYMMHGALQRRHMTEGKAVSIRIRIGDAALVSQTDAASQARLASNTARSASLESMLVEAAHEEHAPRLARAQRDLRLLSDDVDASEVAADHTERRLSVPDQTEPSSNGPSMPPDGKIRFDEVEASEDLDDFGDAPDYPERVTDSRNGPEFVKYSEVDARPRLREESSLSPTESPRRTIAPTQVAVHGSVSDGSSTHAPNLHASAAAPPLKLSNEQSWRQLMDVYDEGGTQPSTIAPSTTAFTNLRRGHQTRAADTMTAKILDTERQTQPAPAKEKKEVDPDAAWKAFVFGDEKSPTSSSEGFALRLEPEKLAVASKGPMKPIAKAAKQAESSFITSSSGVGPPTPEGRAMTDAHPSSHLHSGDFPYDRPSSLANASTTGTVLHNRATARPKGTFSRPKRLRSGDRGQPAITRYDDMNDEIED